MHNLPAPLADDAAFALPTQDLQDLLILLTRPDLLDDPGPSSGRDDGPSRSSSSSSSPGSSTLDGPSSSSASSLSTGIDEGDRLWLMEAMVSTWVSRHSDD